jgi:hypothetical protein
MEELMRLVAASLARNGIQCPASDGFRETRAASPVPAEPSSAISVPVIDPTALPEHNYRKRLQGDPAP